jgi:hypothetical protein
MTTQERAATVIALLSHKDVNDLVLERLNEQRQGRHKRKLKAARMAAEERDAEYREAWRNLRQAQAAKSPDRAFLEVIFRMREMAEYVRAVVDASMDREAPLAADQRKPELINAIDAVLQAATVAITELRQRSVVIDVTPEKVPGDAQTARVDHDV